LKNYTHGIKAIIRKNPKHFGNVEVILIVSYTVWFFVLRFEIGAHSVIEDDA
jgi:hypothetical protein